MTLALRILLATVLSLPGAQAATAATPYPTKTIRLIVPFPPGGPTDVLARVVAEKLTASLGKPVIVENRAGAGGNTGMEQGAKAAADGHVLTLAPAGNLTVAPSLYKSIPYDVERDFAPVTVIAAVPNLLVVHPSVPVKTVADLVRHAKANPGKLAYSSPGMGSGAHLAGELFKSMVGVDMLHVPYSGTGPAVTAVLGGQVQLMFAGTPVVLQHIKGGKLTALGVASPRRIAAAPDLPTLSDSGLAGFDVTSWYSVVAPAGTPADVVDRLQREIARALTLPDVQEKLAALGAEPIGNTPSDFAKMIRSEAAKWSRIVHEAGIKAE